MAQAEIYPAGMIRYLGLSRWWMREFTPQERAVIESAFGPPGLTQGNVSAASDTPRQYLRAVAGWLNAAYPDLSERVRAKATKVPDRRRKQPIQKNG